MNVIEYRRVSTSRQGESGLGLEAQRASIHAACLAGGHTIVDERTDIISTREDHRPGWAWCLEQVRTGAADGIVVAKLDRCARGLVELINFIDEVGRSDWELVCLNPPIDTSTPHGRAMAAMAAVFAQYERDMIGERTRDALAAKKMRGERTGRPCRVDPEAGRRIRMLRDVDTPWPQIAGVLNDAGFRSPTGREWTATNVRRAHRAWSEDAHSYANDIDDRKENTQCLT